MAAPQPVTNGQLRAALVYQAVALGAHLKLALQESGIEIVYESTADKFNQADIVAGNVEIFVVNLDPELEDHLDDVTDLIDQTGRPVIFNDGPASSSLGGWDQARWARHLASKMRGEVMAHPPQPENAKAIPTPVKVALIKPIPVAPVIEAKAPIVDLKTPIDQGQSVNAAPDALDIGFEEDVFAEFESILESITDDAPADSTPDNIGSDLDLDDLISESSPALRTAEPAEELTDLDELFRRMAADSNDAPVAPAPVSESRPVANTPGRAEKKEAPLEWSLEPLDEEISADEVPVFTPKPTVPPKAAPPVGKSKFSPAPTVPDQIGEELPPLEFDTSDFASLFDEVQEESPVTPKLHTQTQPMPAKGTEPLPDLGLSIEEFEALGFETFDPEPQAILGAVDTTNSLADLDDVFAEIDAVPLSGSSTDLLPDLNRVFVLGASIGGPEAVRTFLCKLTAQVPAAFVLAQHIGAEFIDLMAAQLDKGSPVRVRCPSDGERLKHGQVIVVPVGKRLTIDATGHVRLSPLPTDSPYSPSIDQVMMDMADRFGARCSAIIFSGMASDAIEGSKYLKARGSDVWVQDPGTCVISSMIDGAIAAGIVTFQGAPEALAEKLLEEIQ